MSDDSQGLRDKLTKQGEETLGKFAQDLIDNPLVSGALSRAFEAREKAAQAQVVAMGALNIPSAADVERLTRRLRSVAQRLEGIEDALDRLDRRLESTAKAGADDDLKGQIAELTEQVRALVAKPAAKPKKPPAA
jgi:CRP-like cAMP-binding protein